MTHTRKTSSPVLAIAIVICCFAVGFAIGHLIYKMAHRNGEYRLTVIETTDIHGNYFDSLYNGVPRPSSLANVSAYLKSVRQDEKLDPVLIDCGDNLQGDIAAYYYNFVDTVDRHVVTELFEYLDYDAVVVGNHDIETSHSVYDRINSTIEIPYLAANAVYSDGPEKGKPYFKPYTIVKRKGLKIAIIGMTNANIKSWLPEEKWKGIDFLQVSQIAQEWVDKVRKKEKPDVVILAMHSGAGRNNADKPAVEDESLYVASALKGVDIVLCGHDHRPIALTVPNPEGDVVLMNSGRWSKNVGRCDMVLKRKKGKIVEKSFACNVVPVDSIAPDKEFLDFFRPQFEATKAFANKRIGYLSKVLSFEKALEGPNSYMTLVHTVQLEATGADISISAPLALKGQLDTGVVSFQDLTKVYVYENQLYTVELTGRQLKDYLEFSYDNWIEGRGPSYNYDSAQGIDYTVSRSAAKGNRVKISGFTNGSPFEMDKVYKVAMTSYRASGGGELLEKGAGIRPDELVIIKKYRDIRNLIGDYITQHGTVSPETSTNWKFVN